MAQVESTTLERFLHRLIGPGELMAEATQLGVFQRRRKLAGLAFLSTVLFGVCGRGRHSIAGLQRLFTLKTGIRVARSVFVKRFNPALSKLMERVLVRLQERASQTTSRPPGLLSAFRDVEVVDSTTVRVHRKFASILRGIAAPAALKVHTRIRALSGELLWHRVTEERKADMKVLRLGHWARGVLYLLDRGYADASLWARIERVGGFFLTPLKTSFAAKVVWVNPGHSGSRTRAMGKSVWALATGPGRRARRIDVRCEFKITVRAYNSDTDTVRTKCFRVVGLWNKKLGRYHLYVTNIGVGVLEPEACAQAYRLRWQVELLYAVGKGGLGLGELQYRKRHNLDTFIRVALIKASLTMQARVIASHHLPTGRWLNMKLWARVWTLHLPSLAARWSQPRRQKLPFDWASLALLAVDPNIQRVPVPVALASGHCNQWAS